MKLTPLKDLLKLTKEKIEESLIPIRARQARSRADLQVAKLDEEMANLEKSFQETCMEKEIDFDKLINIMDDADILTRRKGQMAKIVEGLFGE